MVVLGVHGSNHFRGEDGGPGYTYHDAAATIIRDGEVMCAIEEERLNRVKHANTFPLQAIRACMEVARVDWPDVDLIAVNLSRPFVALLDRTDLLHDASRPSLGPSEHRWSAAFRRAFAVDVADKFRFCPHHEAHAWSAFAPSGFERSLILSLDGSGEFASGMVLLGEDRKIRPLATYGLDQSLGSFYSQLINVLGYSRFDEYKVMGLAPYGDPEIYKALFEQVCVLLPGGNYRLAPLTRCFALLHDAGLLESARRRGQPVEQRHKDFAAALQKMLERIVLHIATHYKTETGADRLCLSGGVAHNCTANGVLLYSGLFQEVFVQPAAHDAGGALGAAWWAYHEASPAPRRPHLTHLYHGLDIGDSDEIARAIAPWDAVVAVERPPDIFDTAAHLIADGAVIGWVQGRSEFGPRALGNRSILADPRPADHKRLINQMVKLRESYRPFAPSVLAERAAEYFRLPPAQLDYPFMIFVVEVLERWREVLGAVTHVDGTARIHTVSEQINPRYWRLIKAFERRTGVPILLNTSFNNDAEPIVDSVDDAITCFLTTRIDCLVIGDYLLRRRPVSEKTLVSVLSPFLPPFKKLTRRAPASAEVKFAVESELSRYFGDTSVPVSRAVFDLLMNSAADKSARQLADSARTTLPDDELWRELLRLWERRMIGMRPVRTLEPRRLAPGPGEAEATHLGSSLRPVGVELSAAPRRSVAYRWAESVIKGCNAGAGIKTLSDWGRETGASDTTLSETCRLVGIRPTDARDLTRALFAITRSEEFQCDPTALLDIADSRTLRAFVDRAGPHFRGRPHATSVHSFLDSQRFVDRRNPGVLMLRQLLPDSLSSAAAQRPPV